MKLFTKETQLFKDIRQDMDTIQKIVASERFVDAKIFCRKKIEVRGRS